MVTKSTTDESIERIVAERLDSIFGEDDEEGTPPPPPAKASPLTALRDAADALKQEIGPQSLGRLKDSVRDLAAVRGENPLFRPLLKMIGMLPDYLGTARDGIQDDGLPIVFSLIECMEALEEKDALTDIQRRRRVQKEIESFKAFRDRIQRGRGIPSESPAPMEGPSATPEPPEPLSPEPPVSATPSPEPPSPEHASGRADPWAKDAIDGLRDLVTGGLKSLATRLDGVQASVEKPCPSHAELSERVSQLQRRIEALTLIPDAVEKTRIGVLKGIALTNKTIKEQGQRPLDTEALKTCVREEMDGLKQEIQAWMNGAEEKGRNDSASDEVLLRLKDDMGRLREESASLTRKMEAMHSELIDLRSSLRSIEAGTGQDTRGPAPDPGTQEADEKPDLNATLTLERGGSTSDEPDPTDKGPSPSREDPLTGAYFVFQVGGKNYAVDARHVVKAVRIANGLQKKAHIRGGLTLSETTTGFFALKKGLEEAWSSLPPEEVKQSVYRLVSNETLDGVAGSSAGGALYLRVEEKRYLILSDRAAEKVFLGPDDEVQMAGCAGHESGPLCGSILRAGKGGELYLIVAPERLP